MLCLGLLGSRPCRPPSREPCGTGDQAPARYRSGIMDEDHRNSAETTLSVTVAATVCKPVVDPLQSTTGSPALRSLLDLPCKRRIISQGSPVPSRRAFENTSISYRPDAQTCSRGFSCHIRNGSVAILLIPL